MPVAQAYPYWLASPALKKGVRHGEWAATSHQIEGTSAQLAAGAGWSSRGRPSRTRPNSKSLQPVAGKLSRPLFLLITARMLPDATK
jgi:hypothetical protein